MIRPTLNDERYKLLENITDEAFAYIYDLQKYCDELEDKIKNLEERSEWLSALEAAGVDSWEGMDTAVEIFEESK